MQCAPTGEIAKSGVHGVQYASLLRPTCSVLFLQFFENICNLPITLVERIGFSGHFHVEQLGQRRLIGCFRIWMRRRHVPTQPFFGTANIFRVRRCHHAVGQSPLPTQRFRRCNEPCFIFFFCQDNGNQHILTRFSCSLQKLRPISGWASFCPITVNEHKDRTFSSKLTRSKFNTLFDFLRFSQLRGRDPKWPFNFNHKLRIKFPRDTANEYRN